MSDVAITSVRRRKAIAISWWVYFLFPLFSGLLHYQWLPNESYNKTQHELLASHEVCDSIGRCYDHADEWKDKKTGEVFSRDDFEVHKHAEAIRTTPLLFGYGLIGCFWFGYLNRLKHGHAFYTYLGMAVCINVTISVFSFAMMYF
jgi:hypothetical protein